MPDRPDVVDRADALMRGRRSFVTPPTRVDSAPAGDDEDLPVLTEIVATPVGDDLAVGKPVFDENRLAELGAEMAQAVTQQLSFELPTLVEAAMARATEELRAGIASTIDSAVREFIAAHRPHEGDR